MDYLFANGFYKLSNQSFHEASGTWPKEGFLITTEERDALVAGLEKGKVISTEADGRPFLMDPAPVELTKEQAIAANTAAISAAMEAAAHAARYDSMLSAISYAAQPVGAPFQAQGARFLAWRSEVWMHAYAVLARVEAGEAEMPTPEEAVAAMPALVLP